MQAGAGLTTTDPMPLAPAERSALEPVFAGYLAWPPAISPARAAPAQA